MYSSSKILFQGELQDLLDSSKGKGQIQYPVTRRASVKDVIESLGPPHTEIEKIYVNGIARDFKYILRAGDSVDVYPHTPPVDVTKDSELREGIKDGIKFVIDVNVGKLAKLLRMLGYNTAYQQDWQDRDIADLAHSENRIVLTRDKGLLKRGKVQWGHLLRGEITEKQLKETVDFYGLSKNNRIFSRCLCCNTELLPVKKSQIQHRLEPKTRKYFYRFYLCPCCNRIYWQGSHHKNMHKWLSVLDQYTTTHP